MNNHTPMPWKILDRSTDIVSDSKGTLIAFLIEGNPKTKLANARLIAAAPYLLEALRELAKKWEHEAGPYAPAYINAVVAIAKATGGQP